LKNPDEARNLVQLIPVQLSEKPESITVKQEVANDGLYQVIGKCHLTYLRQPVKYKRKNLPPEKQDE
jgi:hypothetical protein